MRKRKPARTISQGHVDGFAEAEELSYQPDGLEQRLLVIAKDKSERLLDLSGLDLDKFSEAPYTPGHSLQRFIEAGAKVIGPEDPEQELDTGASQISSTLVWDDGDSVNVVTYDEVEVEKNRLLIHQSAETAKDTPTGRLAVQLSNGDVRLVEHVTSFQFGAQLTALYAIVQ